MRCSHKSSKTVSSKILDRIRNFIHTTDSKKMLDLSLTFVLFQYFSLTFPGFPSVHQKIQGFPGFPDFMVTLAGGC